LKKLNDVDHPGHSQCSSEAILQEIKQTADIESEIGNEKLFETLLEFYNEKTHRILRENMLLISRWGKFCRSSFDITKFAPAFRRQQTILKHEYADAADRYERLFEIKSLREQNAKNILKQNEKKRMDDELRGMAVIRSKFIEDSSKGTKQGNVRLKLNKTHPKKIDSSLSGQEKVGDHKSNTNDYSTTDYKSNPMSGVSQTCLGEISSDEMPQNSEISIADMTVFLRSIITSQKGQKDIDTFIARTNQIVFCDKLEMIVIFVYH
jgi:uncharacterized protein YrzB (UPF0473 family)